MKTGEDRATAGTDTERQGEGLAPASRDGRILMLLIVVLLFSPYLPQIGPVEGRFRFDTLFLPVATLWVVWREAKYGSLRLVPVVAAYAAFVVWLFTVSGMILIEPVPEYGSLGSNVNWEKATHMTDFLSGAETYARPLMVLLIVTKLRVPTEDVIRAFRAILYLGAPLLVIGLLQLLPPTRTITTDLIYFLYTNQREGTGLGIKYVLSGGRVMSIFGQVGTFGQFAVTCLAVLGVHRYGGEVVRSRRVRTILFVLAFLGGIASGSKVFSGGVLMLIVLMGLPRYLLRRPKLVLGVGVIGVGIAFAILQVLSTYAIARIATYWFDIPSLIENYGSGRFFMEAGGPAPKIIRTLALNIVFDYPVTGLGLPVITRTVDSFWIGIVVMSGTLGLATFIFVLYLAVRRMRVVERTHRDPTIAAAAKMMFFVTLIYAAAAIGFHTFVQDRIGDLYWLYVGLLVSSHLDPRRVGDPPNSPGSM